MSHREEAPGHNQDKLNLSAGLVFPLTRLRRWPGRGRSELLCLGCCPPGSDLGKQKKRDGCMDMMQRVHGYMLSFHPPAGITG